MASPKSKQTGDNTIAVNRKARHDYTIEADFEAGLVLQGWEVKSLRAGKVQIAESHVIIKKAEAFLLGSHITPLLSASTHVKADSTRTRKLLLKRKELNTLIGAVQQKGYTLIPLSLYWIRGKAKLKLALAKGKKHYDKRHDEKKRDFERQKARILRN